MTKLTRAWLRKAQGNLRAAQLGRTMRPPSHDTVCFHCHEAVQKLLKTMLIEFGDAAPETDDPKKLLRLVRRHDPAFDIPLLEMEFLRYFSVAYDYQEAAMASDAKQAVAWAEQVCSIVRKSLKLRA